MRAPFPEPQAILNTLAFQPLDRVTPAAIETLLDAAFGADRRQRTAYRLREGVAAVPHLSFALEDRHGLMATVQSWPVELRHPGGAELLLLLGPIAVRPDRQQAGLGRAITAHALAAIDRAGESATVLIGDPEYYGRFFGFTADGTSGWTLPGPVERRRLLVRLTGGRVLPAQGRLQPRGG